MSSNQKATAIAALVSIVCGIFSMAVTELRTRRAEAATNIANEAAEISDEAYKLAKNAAESARVGTWHLMIAATGPQSGMPVTYRDDIGGDHPGVLVVKVGDGWMVAVFDHVANEWSTIGPILEGTREENGVFVPAICAGMRPGFQGAGHDHSGH